MIKDIVLIDNHQFEGTFTLTTPTRKTASNGNEYLLFTLRDSSGHITGFAWLNRYFGPVHLIDGMHVHVVGKIIWNNIDWTADITNLVVLGDADTLQPAPVTQASYSELFARMSKLRAFKESITNDKLRELVAEFIDDDSIKERFFTLPASEKHHHAYIGGLFDHSLEAASIVAQHMEFKQEIRELGIVAALLHDVGKMRTLGAIHRPLEGHLLHHDLLTLEVLKPHLDKLGSAWECGATALRYLLTFTSSRRKDSFPLLTVAEAVIAADRISAGLDRERRHFYSHRLC